MRALLSLGLSAMFGCLGLVLFWQVHVEGVFDGPGALIAQIDEATAVWNSQNVSPGARVLTLIISDAESSGDPLALPEAPSSLDKARDFFRRAYLGKSRAAAEDSAFARAFARDSATIMWTRARFPSPEEENMTREIMAAIVKARDSGAQLDIVTQGLSAGPVLRAIKKLESRTRGGEAAGVNKLVTVGMNLPTLARIDPYFRFGRPRNLREWAAVWKMDEYPSWTEIAVLSADSGDRSYSADSLYHPWGAQMGDLAPVVKDLFRNAAPMVVQFDPRAPVYSATRAAAAGSPAASAARSQDSSSMVVPEGGPQAAAPEASGAAPVGGQGVLRYTPREPFRLVEVRLSRAIYYGYQQQEWFADDNAACMRELPRNSPPGLRSSLCSIGDHASSTNPFTPPLDKYSDAWGWANGSPLQLCPSEAETKTGKFPNATTTLVSRGGVRSVPCTEAHPIACCVMLRNY
ncbi:MAG: hypothetical protein ACHQ2Z_15190 [Elusimicrobiota bacterium]